MGILTDRLTAEIAEMRARHEEQERKMEATLGRCFKILDELKKSNRELLNH